MDKPPIFEITVNYASGVQMQMLVTDFTYERKAGTWNLNYTLADETSPAPILFDIDDSVSSIWQRLVKEA
jgi:hypothetical protein